MSVSCLNRILVLPNMGIKSVYCCSVFTLKGFFSWSEMDVEAGLSVCFMSLNYFWVTAFPYSVHHSLDLSMDEVCIS